MSVYCIGSVVALCWFYFGNNDRIAREQLERKIRTAQQTQCQELCQDHRVFSCIPIADEVVATCVDYSSPTMYVTKSKHMPQEEGTK
jgi:hypothetical protein